MEVSSILFTCHKYVIKSGLVQI
uniref:Uncharacterized protein n=1 Tax=Arundo donax TaxID=35708 RepID=A0A0A9G9W6_ARUDO